MPQTFARRARLSSKAIFAAVALTLAGLVALAITTRDATQTAVKTMSPVSQKPLLLEHSTHEGVSALVPVINR